MQTWQTKNGYRVIRVLGGSSNVFLTTNGTFNILIDTSPRNRFAKLQRNLEKLGVDTIDYLILTHSHYDHAQNASRIKRRYNARVVVHCTEAHYLESGTNTIPRGTNPFTRFLVSRFGKWFAKMQQYEPCGVDIAVDSPFDLRNTGISVYTLHTPGHSPGSMSVIVDDEIAFVGDALFGVFRGSVSPPFADDVGLMVRSWGRLLETPCSIFLPAHGNQRGREVLLRKYAERNEGLL
jgi:glyoxylase-like metal-dependent hydrolase (beta-lactamase superfamily II)